MCEICVGHAASGMTCGIPQNATHARKILCGIMWEAQIIYRLPVAPAYPTYAT
jgi:hypothetical protein